MSVDATNITLDARPQRKAGIIAQHVLDEMVLYDAEKEEGFSLNQSARSIWDLCDGVRTVQEICNELAAPLSIKAELLHEDVLVAIQQLASQDLLVLNEQPTSV